MSIKRFGTQLRALLAGLDKDEKFTPSELIEKVKSIRNSGQTDSRVIEGAIKTPRFVRKIIKSYRRSPSGRIVLYTKKGEPMVMTLERMTTLQTTVKNAAKGLRRYYESRKAVAA
jgi:hypothetical protein